MAGTHESLDRDAVKPGSERSFGLVFAAVFAIIASWPMLSANGPRLWALAVTAVFLLTALLRPELLKPLNRLWFRLGMLMHRVLTPLVLGAIFIAGVLPTAAIMRARRKDPLRIDPRWRDRSNWVVRTPPGPPPETMQRLF